LLLEKYPDFSVIEVDKRAVEVLREKYPELRIDEGDVLAFDWMARASASGQALSVIGNLPYNITSQILFSLFDAAASIREVVVMMQYEVALRLIAVPSTKSYGILSVATQLLCEPKMLFQVSRNVFFPQPDVRSAVVRLDFSTSKSRVTASPMEDFDASWTRRVIRTAFNQRRKALRNSLKTLAAATSATVPIQYADKRAEELTPDDFVELARYLQAGS